MKSTDELIHTLSDILPPTQAPTSPAVLFSGWCIFASSYIVLMLMFFGTRSDLMIKLTSSDFVIEIILLTVIILTSGLSAILLAFPDMMQKQWVLATPFISFLLFALNITLLWMNEPNPVEPVHGIMCSLSITLFSLLPAFTLFYIVRKHATTHIMVAGAITLLSAVSIGCLILRLSEQTDSLHHLMLWHYAPLILLTLLGIFLGKTLLKW